MSKNNLYIVDNKEEQKTVRKYLLEWCEISKQFDIATGYFEIGGLLALEEKWQHLDKIRIILGAEVTNRTYKAIQEATQHLIDNFDKSMENEHEQNALLRGTPAVIQALKSRKIECRVYNKYKFHAKAYITHFKDEVYNSINSALNIPKEYALVGSSNFTKPGLTQNIELNVQFSTDVDLLQEWFEERWNEAEDVTDSLLSIMNCYCREISPNEIYLKSMYELFKGRSQSISEWEASKSKIYPILAQYQKDGYDSLINIAEKYAGAFLCDGVGLGKTYVGLMLIERLVFHERKNVVLIVPAAARESVWESTIKKYMPEILGGFNPFIIINHTDLTNKNKYELLENIKNKAEAIIIDEAHHFRNRASERYRTLFDIMSSGQKKNLYMLTATPINNSFRDFQHLIELFTGRNENYFKMPPLGIHSLKGHFDKMESRLGSLMGTPIIDTSSSSNDADNVFKGDPLVKELVVQRSRAYVKESLSESEGENVIFPTRLPPVVAKYSLKKGYGRLIDDFVDSFYKKDKKTGKLSPILMLAVYCPYADCYFKGDRAQLDSMKLGRQEQVVNLIRQLLLKRFESSPMAFLDSCIRIFTRLNKFVEEYKEYGIKREIDHFYARNDRVIEYIKDYIEQEISSSIEELEEDVPDYLWEIDENLSIDDFDIGVILQDTISDLEVLSDFIRDLMVLSPDNDDKLNQLKRLLTEEACLQKSKVIIFTEYRSTAVYLYKELRKMGLNNIFELDGLSQVNRGDVIARFAPYYNGSKSSDIDNEIQVLISTDVLSEGLNLQDATCLINYELHWNPVRLMQRIGRIDRRRDIIVETSLLADHPEMAEDRENLHYWNFLPPEELEKLLSLYKTVSQKTLRISKTFGIEGKQLLTPEDDYEALKDFNSAYDGAPSQDERLELEFQELLKTSEFEAKMQKLRNGIFSGKLYGEKPGVFFCYSLPILKSDNIWTSKNGLVKWFFVDAETRKINTDIYEIHNIIKTSSNEPRAFSLSEESFAEYEKIVKQHIAKTYMRDNQVPAGIKPLLIAWLQLIKGE